MSRFKLVNVCLIAAFSIGGLIACNDNADTAEKGTATDSSMMNNDSTTRSTAATETKTAKKKGKTSITMPQGSTEKMMKDEHGVYNFAETMPEFPGGQDGLSNYVNNNAEYSQTAIDNNTTGTVKVSFVVDEKGKIMDAHVVNTGAKVGNGLDEVALKVVNNMPSWKPGKVHGKNVKTRLELPITFQLEA